MVIQSGYSQISVEFYTHSAVTNYPMSCPNSPSLFDVLITNEIGCFIPASA
jgi:hypothetical protein